MKQTAQKLASKGRFGDSMLVHMNPVEVSGLASLMPDGELSINPDTGLPEAFFFLPALMAAMGPAIGGIGAAGLGALGTGAAAGTALGLGAAGTGAALSAGTAATLAGTAAAAPVLAGTAAAAAPALTAATAAAPAALAGPMSIAGPMSTIASGMPGIEAATAMSQIPAAGLPGIEAASALPAELSGIGSGFAPGGGSAADILAGYGPLAPPPTSGLPGSIAGDVSSSGMSTHAMTPFETSSTQAMTPFDAIGAPPQQYFPATPQPGSATTRSIAQISPSPSPVSTTSITPTSPPNGQLSSFLSKPDPVGSVPIPRSKPIPSNTYGSPYGSTPRPKPLTESFGSNVGLDNFGSSVGGDVPTTADAVGEPLNLLEPETLGDPEGGGFGGLNMKNMLLPAVLGYGLLNQGDDEPDKKEFDESDQKKFERGAVDFSNDPFEAGQFEPNYFPDAGYSLRFAHGGIVGGPDQRPAPNLSAFNNPGTQAVNNTMPYQPMNNPQANPPAFGGANPMSQGIAPSQNMSPGFGAQPTAYGSGGVSPSPTFGWGAGSDVSNSRQGGIMNGYAGGGIVKKTVDNSYADGGLAGLDAGSMMGQGVPGGIMPEQGTESQDKQLVMMTIAAIQGQIPNAEKIIQLFIETFGEEALMDLMERLQGGDGKSDSIPAQISSPQGSQPAQLSEGEYVVPADVVSTMGKGSTDAGGRQLDNMVAGQRGMMQQPQQPQQPFQLLPGKV